MGKGDHTRARIVDEALQRASVVGLEGISIGELAAALGMSKSGLFRHFNSKEQLQVDVLEHAAAQFTGEVVYPSLKHPRGVPRIDAVVENWLKWAQSELPGGCVFISASSEFDDRQGPVRAALVRMQFEWLAFITKAAALAVAEGHLRADLDTDQFAYELHGVLLEFQFQHRLLANEQAPERTRTAYRALLERARP